MKTSGSTFLLALAVGLAPYVAPGAEPVPKPISEQAWAKDRVFKAVKHGTFLTETDATEAGRENPRADEPEVKHPDGEKSVPESEEDLEEALGIVDRGIRDCLEAEDFHGAARLLPREAVLWEKLMARTGNQYEGAHGFLHGLVMSRTAAIGDSQWGKILDDPEIPYRYKTELVFWVLEERLGKGSVYAGNEANFIIPIPRRLEFEREERFRLPKGISNSEPNRRMDAMKFGADS